MSPAPELKATLTLPQTAFSMKANLPQNEPLRLAHWAKLDLYEEMRKAGRGRPVYLLHDGPPYANGPIHLGHALNKGLKDFVVKSKTMAGFDAPYVPGYDCHGLPIEIKVDEKLGHKKLSMPVPEILEACRAYAQKYVDLQTEQFERIGCFGRWEKPYKTMARDYEARTLEAFYGFLEKGFVYRGLKPVYWCIHDRTTLAEAEVEYAEPHQPVDLRALPADLRSGHHRARARRQAGFDHHLDNHPMDPARVAGRGIPPRFRIRGAGGRIRRGLHCRGSAGRASGRLPASSEPTKELARFKGAVLDRVTFQHPFLDRSILGVLATYVTADTGTGAVHTAPSHGADDFYTGQRYGLDPTSRVDAGGHIHFDPDSWHRRSLRPTTA